MQPVVTRFATLQKILLTTK